MRDDHGAAGEIGQALLRARAAYRRRDRWSARRAAEDWRPISAFWRDARGCARRPKAGRPSSADPAPLKLKAPRIGARIDLALAEIDDVIAAGNFLPDVLLAVERIARLIDIAELTESPMAIAPLSGFSCPVIMRNRVVLPAPLGPITPTMPPGGSLNESDRRSAACRRSLSRDVENSMTVIAEPLGDRNDDLRRRRRLVVLLGERDPHSAGCAPWISPGAPWGSTRSIRSRPRAARWRASSSRPSWAGASASASARTNNCPRRGCRGRDRVRESSPSHCRGNSGRG